MKCITISRIAGPFWGWLGQAAYRLENGQIWKQVHYLYEYHHAERPRATVWRSGADYYLEVAGMSAPVKVKRGAPRDLEDR